MRRIESYENDMKGIVTFEFTNGQRINLDAHMVSKYGAAELLRGSGYEDLIPTERMPVMQDGRQVGTVPGSFDGSSVKSNSFWYEPRRGDFVREGDAWVASRMLGPGDLDAVAGFQRA